MQLWLATGGDPLLRDHLETLVVEARRAGHGWKRDRALAHLAEHHQRSGQRRWASEVVEMIERLKIRRRALRQLETIEQSRDPSLAG